MQKALALPQGSRVHGEPTDSEIHTRCCLLHETKGQATLWVEGRAKKTEASHQIRAQNGKGWVLG